MKNYFKIAPSLLIFFLFISVFVLSSCTSKSLRIHSDEIPPDSLRLAQVLTIPKRSDVIQRKKIYDAIIANGIHDTQIIDGSVIEARVWCCGGMSKSSSPEIGSSKIIFVPRGIHISQGDIVEVRSGTPASKQNRGKMNVVTRVVQKSSQNYEHCWWEPKDNRLWLRVLYCDWMPSEGWIKQGGIYPAWYKPNISKN